MKTMKPLEKKELNLLAEIINLKDYVKMKKQLSKLLNYARYDSISNAPTSNSILGRMPENDNCSIQSGFSTPKFRLELSKQFEIVKVVLRNDISFFLANNYQIKNEIFDLVNAFDEEYQVSIQKFITDYIIKKYIESLTASIFNETYFFSVGFLKKSIVFYEKTLENIKLYYSHLPRKYNLDGEFTFTFFTAMKRKIMPLLFNFKVKDSEILEGIKIVLDFEVKYGKINYSKNCCEARTTKSIIFEKDNIKCEQESIIKKFKEINLQKMESKNSKDIKIIEGSSCPVIDSKIENQNKKKPVTIICEHKKLLTKIFLPFLETYVIDLFKNMKTREVQKENYECGIFYSFINFFKEIGDIFTRVQYFNDDRSFNFLIDESDKALLNIFKKMQPAQNFKEACITLNSLVYVESTYSELQERIFEKSGNSYYNLKFQKEIRSIEKNLYKFIDGFVKENLLKLKLQKDTRFSISIFQFIRKHVYENGLVDINEEVSYYILETITSQLFTSILQIKLNPQSSKFLFSQFQELKEMVFQISKKIPLSEVIENYLQIFFISPKDTENFIDNFSFFSNGTFSFIQILKLLEDISNNVKLYLEFKRRK